METSLRFAGGSKILRIHAKEKYPINENYFLEFRGELDTKYGTPIFLSAAFRQFYPNLSTSLGVGVQHNWKNGHHYTVRAKKAFEVSTDGIFNFCVKARGQYDPEFKLEKYNGAAEFVVTKFGFKKDQDMRLKFGYEVFEKLPYLQIRENNWTLNVDIDGRWNIRYGL